MEPARKPLADYGTEIARTGDSLGQLGDQLRRVGAAPVGAVLESGAGYAKRWGEYLQNADVPMLVHDLDAFAQQQPALVIVGGFFAGLATARMLKAGKHDDGAGTQAP